MRTLLLRGASASLIVAGAIASACSSSDTADSPGSGGSSGADASAGAAGAAGSGGGSATGGTAGAGGSGGASSGGASGSSGAGGSGGSVSDASVDINLDVTFNYDAPTQDGFNSDAACAKTVVNAEPTPLDMAIMLDKSGSMLDATQAGPTKWNAVKQALTGFLNNSGSAGLGVGIQYFPLTKPGVPTSCTNNAQCGAGAPCMLKTCANSTSVKPCAVNKDCGNGAQAQCVDLGQCLLSGQLCVPVGALCGLTGGPCVKITTSRCFNATTCSAADYAKPAVGIATLPGNATAIINSINAQTPAGLTPTGPALQGAVNYAKSYATANPTHTVVTVLATDGLPTECTPLDIPSIAAIASAGAAGTPSVKTFVIGVFAQGDIGAKQNVDAIAKAGGTNAAFIVDPAQNVTAQFLAALAQIQGKSVGCEFKMPKPSQGVVDPTKVELSVTLASGTTIINRVTNAAQCSGAGWYYDNNAAPTKITLCPASCTQVKADANPKIDISLGCLGS